MCRYFEEAIVLIDIADALRSDSLSRRSISRTALCSVFAASFGSVIIGVRDAATSFGITQLQTLRIHKDQPTRSGVALYRIDMMKALIATLLPAPVEPAISRCGMPARSATTIVR